MSIPFVIPSRHKGFNLLGFSWMNRYVPTHFSHVNQFLSGCLLRTVAPCGAIAPAYNLVGSQPIRGKRQTLVKLWASLAGRSCGNVRVTTGSSTALAVPDASVDYVFVDPPFGKNIPYSDLALVVEQWHGVTTHAMAEDDPRTISRRRGLDEYADLMSRCFAEFFRVLKPGRWMTVEFSNHSNDVWLRIQNALASAGFVVADTRVIDKEQLSYRQVTAEHAVKHDLVISAYKPAETTERTFGLAAGSADGAWAFVREHLSRISGNGGRSRSGVGRAGAAGGPDLRAHGRLPRRAQHAGADDRGRVLHRS